MAESKSGSFVVNNNTGSFTVNVDADQLTDGQKTMSVQIRTDSTRGPIIGNLSAAVVINDTSFTPAGTILSQGCIPNTTTYRVTRANGNGGMYNEDTPNSPSCGYVAPPTYPAAGTILNQFCVPGSYTYRLTRANGSGGSYNEDILNSPSCGYVAPPTYPVAGTILSQGCVPNSTTYRVTRANGSGGSYNEDILNSPSCGYITPVVVTRTMNWTPSAGDFTEFSERGNFTGWIGDITKANALVDSTERSNVVNNSVVRQGFRDLGSILGISITETDITTGLNAVINDINAGIDNYLGSNTQAICLAGVPAKFTTATSFVQNGIRYTRTTLRTSQINYGIDFSKLPPVSDLAEAATAELVRQLAASGYNVNSSQRSQLKSSITGILQSIIDILRSISDKVDLYDYTEQPA